MGKFIIFFIILGAVMVLLARLNLLLSLRGQLVKENCLKFI